MTGEEAKRLFDEANALVKQGRYEEARRVPMLPSDHVVIDQNIARHQAKAQKSPACEWLDLCE